MFLWKACIQWVGKFFNWWILTRTIFVYVFYLEKNCISFDMVIYLQWCCGKSTSITRAICNLHLKNESSDFIRENYCIMSYEIHRVHITISISIARWLHLLNHPKSFHKMLCKNEIQTSLQCVNLLYMFSLDQSIIYTFTWPFLYKCFHLAYPFMSVLLLTNIIPSLTGSKTCW